MGKPGLGAYQPDQESRPKLMDLDGQQYLDALASLPSHTLESRFANTLAVLGLGGVFDRNELKLLYGASARALACNLAINGFGMVGEQIRPQDEARRAANRNRNSCWRAISFLPRPSGKP